jgi:hypothetical protein
MLNRAATIITLIAFVHCSQVWAGLGGPPGGVEVDGQPLVGTTKILPASNYTVHELNSADLVVKEYVSSNGTVFAVSWVGRRVPGLAALLGRYFDEYSESAPQGSAEHPRLRGAKKQETAHLVVETGGHMGAIWGKAYVPDLFPPGITSGIVQ